MASWRLCVLATDGETAALPFSSRLFYGRIWRVQRLEDALPPLPRKNGVNHVHPIDFHL